MADQELQTKHLNFSLALEALKDGSMIQRAGWHGKGMHLELQTPDENSKMTEPYVFIVIPRQYQENESGASNVPEQRVPWLCSQTDLLANDWQLLEVDSNADRQVSAN